MKKQAITEVWSIRKSCCWFRKSNWKDKSYVPNDRSYAGNLEAKLLDIKGYLYIVRSDEKYLTQPKFTKIFETI